MKAVNEVDSSSQPEQLGGSTILEKIGSHLVSLVQGNNDTWKSILQQLTLLVRFRDSAAFKVSVRQTSLWMCDYMHLLLAS